MLRALAILKYVPAVVCGLLVVAWVVSALRTLSLISKEHKMNPTLIWSWLVLMALVATGGATALARPPYPAIFQEHYANNEPVAVAAKKANCNICHTPVSQNLLAGGKPRNPYGLALAKHIGSIEFRMLKEPEQKQELAAKLKEALKAVEAEKGPDGKTFGDVIKSGNLPVPAEPSKEDAE